MNERRRMPRSRAELQAMRVRISPDRLHELEAKHEAETAALEAKHEAERDELEDRQAAELDEAELAELPPPHRRQ